MIRPRVPNDKFRPVQIDSINFADDKINEMEKFLLGRVEDIVGKGENAGLPAFSPFPTMFSKGFFYRVIKVMIVW